MKTILNFKEESCYRNKHVLIIDGGSRQSLPMIRGFFNLGCIVSVFCSSKLDLGYCSKFAHNRIIGIINQYDEHQTLKSIIETLACNHYDLVIPTNDIIATILSKNKKDLSQFATIYVNDWETYHKAYDKLQTMKKCMENDIPCPKTAEINSISDFDETNFNYPLVVKPRSSFGARGFNVVNNRKEMIECFNRTEAKFGPSLIQEFIPQNDKQYQVELLIDKDHNCKAFLLMEKVRWYPVNGGSSTMNITIHDETIKKDCLKLMKLLNWRGYASLDLIRDSRDGLAKIMEINPRLNGTAKICFASGINLCKLILQDAFNDEVDEMLNYSDGIRLRYFHMDVLWFLRSPLRFKTCPSWFDFSNTVDEIIDVKDIRPAIVYSFVSIKKLFADKKNRSV